MRWLLDFFWAGYELARLAIVTKFRLRGAYWAWRWQTALGSGAGISRGQRVRAIIEYGRWVAKMRRG